MTEGRRHPSRLETIRDIEEEPRACRLISDTLEVRLPGLSVDASVAENSAFSIEGLIQLDPSVGDEPRKNLEYALAPANRDD